MSRKKLPGRAALSFDTTDGILDIDQILNATPWNEIDDFVQHNFMQNILDQFNEQITLDPKRIPAEKKKPSSRARKNVASQTKEENSVAINNSEPSSVDGLKAAVKESKETKATIKGGGKEKVNDTKKKKLKTKKRPTRRGQNVPESEESEDIEKLKKVSSFKAKKAIVNGPTRKRRSKVKAAEDPKEIESTTTEDAMKEGGMSTVGPVKLEIASSTMNESKILEYRTEMETSRSSESVRPFETSTPKREDLSIGDVAEEKNTAEDPKNTKSVLHATNLSNNNIDNNNNCPKSPVKTKKGKGKKKMSAKLKAKNTTEKKHNIEKPIKKEKELKSTEKTRSKTTKMALKGNERDQKMATDIGKKKIGKFEKRLREKEEKRRKRKILRHEKKAQRALEKFSRHAASIAKKMGILPGKDSKDFCSSAGRYDLSRQSSYSSSSSYTSCSCSCSCSHSSSSSYASCSCSCSCSHTSSSSNASCSCSCSCKSCSCTDSCDSYGTDEYSEYTLCSSSECGCDS